MDKDRLNELVLYLRGTKRDIDVGLRHVGLTSVGDSRAAPSEIHAAGLSKCGDCHYWEFDLKGGICTLCAIRRLAAIRRFL